MRGFALFLFRDSFYSAHHFYRGILVRTFFLRPSRLACSLFVSCCDTLPMLIREPRYVLLPLPFVLATLFFKKIQEPMHVTMQPELCLEVVALLSAFVSS